MIAVALKRMDWFRSCKKDRGLLQDIPDVPCHGSRESHR